MRRAVHVAAITTLAASFEVAACTSFSGSDSGAEAEAGSDVKLRRARGVGDAGPSFHESFALGCGAFANSRGGVVATAVAPGRTDDSARRICFPAVDAGTSYVDVIMAGGTLAAGTHKLRAWFRQAGDASPPVVRIGFAPGGAFNGASSAPGLLFFQLGASAIRGESSLSRPSPSACPSASAVRP